MTFKRIPATLLGIFLFFGGIAITISLSSVMTWGEVEARIFVSQTGSKTLKLECPLMIAPWENAVIKTVVTNTLRDESVKPQVNAFISHKKDMRVVSNTLELAPLESHPLQWTVNIADLIFERLILVNVLQRPYRDLPSRQGACSILVYSLFGLNGEKTLALLTSIGILTSLLGAWILFFLHRPFTNIFKSFAQLNGIFLCLTLLGLFSAHSRLWGLTLIFNATALLIFSAGNIEIFFPKK